MANVFNGALSYNNTLHYEVAENAMRTDELAEVAELADCAIRNTRSTTIIFVFTTPLTPVHFCAEKV